MTWAQLIKAKDVAWAEYLNTGPVPSVTKCEAAYRNYLWWQSLIDGDVGGKLYAVYKQSMRWK